MACWNLWLLMQCCMHAYVSEVKHVMPCWNLWLLKQCCMHAYVAEVESCHGLLESVAADAVLHACICLRGGIM
jgi:hypothetical protein